MQSNDELLDEGLKLTPKRLVGVSKGSPAQCNLGISIPRRLEKLSTCVRGWKNDYALSETYRPMPELEE